MAIQSDTSALNRLASATRAGDWWDYKLVPVLMVSYASAVRCDVPVGTLWFPILTLLGALIPGAIYVSLINDLTDTADDAAAGKTNWLIGRTRTPAILGIFASLAAGCAFAWYWRTHPILLSLYAAAWVAFTLYSVPPFRLKTRALAGVIADAGGSNLFPVLLAATMTMNAAEASADWLWLVSVGCWGFAYGLRGILWHQLVDAESDRVGGVNTFAQRYGARAAQRLGASVAAPLELIALALILVQVDSLGALVALALYYWFVEAQIDLFRMVPILVSPHPRSIFVGQRYYDLFLPLGILAGSAMHYPVDAIVLAVHLILFPGRPLQWAAEIGRMGRVIQERKYSSR